jgi:CO/xanthine dehydrogenase Mo-binding subunit
MPTALDLPMIGAAIVEGQASDGPYGIRGLGEGPIVPPPAAIANAIHRAIGVRMYQLLMSPERIRFAIAQHGNDGSRQRACSPPPLGAEMGWNVKELS